MEEKNSTPIIVVVIVIVVVVLSSVFYKRNFSSPDAPPIPAMGKAPTGGGAGPAGAQPGKMMTLPGSRR